MNIFTNTRRQPLLIRSAIGGLLLTLSIGNLSALAANTDISNTPLASTSDITAKPNVMFVLDGSGSMAWSFMPDDLGDGSNGNPTDSNAFGRYGGRASQCNGLAYNPDFPYEDELKNLPVKPDGTPYPHASFNAAPDDGFQVTAVNANYLTSPITIGTGDRAFTITNSSPYTTNTTVGNDVVIYNLDNPTQWMIGKVKSWSIPTVTVTITDAVGGGNPNTNNWAIGTRYGTNLANSFYYTYSGTKQALGWKYTKDGLDKAGDGGFANECLRSTSSGSSVFTKVTLTASSTDAQRYADWYAYYRKRYLLMRTVAGRSFKPIDDKFRVGFTTIADKTATPSSTFLDVNAFDTTQKAKFYASLYVNDPVGSTPLRGALSKVGRYFANKAPGQQSDPMQYACQRNYTILSTDGYWNSGLETSSYGPLKLDGSTNVGQQDALEDRPMYDGATVTVKTKKTWTTTSTKVDTTVTPKFVTSTSAITTKTFTPLRGLARNSYSLGPIPKSTANTGMTRCSTVSSKTCTSTVTTSGNHNYSVGSQVTITGASSPYSGTFVITAVTANTFTAKITLPNSTRPSAPTQFGSSQSTCSALVTQPQQGDEYTVTTSTATDTTTTSSTLTAVKTTTVITPWTNTVIYVNDALFSQTGDVAGTPSTTAPVVNTTTAGTTVLSQSTSSGTAANVIDWSNNGPATTGATCIASLPNPNPSTPTAGALSPSAASYSGAGSAVTTGPTASNGTPATTTDGPAVVSTPVVIDETTTVAGGSSNSLADVAEYYYVTDLRTSALSNCVGALGVDVCNNEVPPSGRDTASGQHMTTFTLGLGVNGILDYRTNYLSPSQTEGSYYKILNNKEGVMWPNPSATEDATHVDDLWHAAVNGRGQYWATSDPGSLSEAISTALSSVKETTGASSSAATSSLKPVPGDENLVFVATFKTVEWSGDLIAYTLDAKLGVIDLKAPIWSAKDQLASLAATSRKIYYAKPGSATNVRQDFTYANLSSDGLAGNLTGLCTQASVAGQCATLPVALKTIANSGTNLVNYLRGDASLTSYTYAPDSSKPDVTTTAAIYRPRAAVLGDIINASPVYLSKPPFHYADTGYADFVTNKAARQPVVFAAANDGMLHAFAAKSVGSTQGGTELWAYVPRTVIPNLYLLADVDYKDKHRYFVDGTPTIGDIYVNGAWKTILVGGLNSGGKGYYALDITDPTDPKPLWEFTDANLGLTYGNPVITKRANGTWVVVFTSGYNNSTGDGNGRLYVLNANTGVALSGTPTVTSIPTMTSTTTPAGTSAAPSGLGKLNAWIEDSSDNTAKRFYSGDLLGNLWRFDVDQLVEPKGKAFLLATFLNTDGTPQPIMTRPETAEVSYNSVNYPVILVGTGRYLGLTDIADKSVQSIYAVKDNLSQTGLGDVRQRTDIVQQSLTDVPDSTKGAIPTRTSSANTVDWGQASGWRVDLPSPGERVAIDMQLQYNTLAVISAIPGTNVCKPAGGSSWLYTFDIAKGVAPTTAVGTTGTYLGDFLGVGLTWIELGDGTSRLIIPGSDASMNIKTPPSPGSSGGATAHRTSWRELVN